ncbi:glycosyltransferase [Mycolicibacterium holsaticum]|uniref:Glycosyl transferase n=1 Tax=Mycolicibacterium holsaticum TaxID=152142 RepID=A0A1E3RBT4_9MYCO|nr:glycosyltransferase [Mycolicibacterium holsaticum]MDA4110316.1 glycosyl transferase [Mycolicibacterium holsaticum DSM 44478 = JCM 12374]ODQ87358.1 glycosyl transferase [Mycolicibacterium holsaticum]QZA11096.1 glycosyltransferase [Mycolicibacterium holsaticum DSM 44478 = JCM 12374]UNC11410.1 glycosyltransferase family 1 protein [Mycolicibacterium holsaticum DSM 44478 = JCM 12374]
MATILAYTSPALGHLFPMSAVLSELASRGHTIHLRTLSAGVEAGRSLGFATEAIDPGIEAITQDDWQGSNPIAALRISASVFGRRAEREIDDLAAAQSRVRPDALLLDVNCWGALCAAEAGDTPWATFCPYTPLLRSPGVPPFGLGLRPLPGALGRARDAAATAALLAPLERVGRAPLNAVRARVGLAPVRSMDEFLRGAPMILIASGKPFQYRQTDWGPTVHMIGPCIVDPGADVVPEWLSTIERPIVLVSTSSEKQDDADLISTAMAALADQPVHVVATIPAGEPAGLDAPANATLCRYIPHSLVLGRSVVCAVTHGGMGVTQKALNHGVPVCVVPYGRDQFEVARRVEVARCGTQLPAKKLSVLRLSAKVREAMTMTEGARLVAEGFAATGGPPRGAALFEQCVLAVA